MNYFGRLRTEQSREGDADHATTKHHHIVWLRRLVLCRGRGVAALQGCNGSTRGLCL